jgi:hypothetical protein
MSSLIATLKNLKDKIFSLENTTVQENKEPIRFTTTENVDISNIKDNQERLNKKLENLIKFQQNRLKINAGGKFFEISSEIILNTTFPNIFEKEILNSSKINFDYNSEIFFDCNPKIFGYIYKIFGVFQTSQRNHFNENNKYKLLVSEEVDVDILKAFIKQVFPNHFEKLNKIMEIKGGGQEAQTTTSSEVTTIAPTNNDYNYDNYEQNRRPSANHDYVYDY